MELALTQLAYEGKPVRYIYSAGKKAQHITFIVYFSKSFTHHHQFIVDNYCLSLSFINSSIFHNLVSLTLKKNLIITICSPLKSFEYIYMLHKDQ